MTCYRYIELNPVRAVMVSHPDEYPWSSYSHNALGENDELIVQHPLYISLAKSEGQRQKAYRALFRARIPNKAVDEIREMTNKSWVLGSDHFKDKIESLLDRPTRPRPKGGDRKSKAFQQQRDVS